MQRLQHMAIAPQGDNAVSPIGIGVAVARAELCQCIAGFGGVRGEKGDRLVFHAGFIALTDLEIAYMEGGPFGNP